MLLDPKIKDHVRKYLSTNNNSIHHNNHQLDLSYTNSITSPTSPIINTNSINRGHRISSSDSSACRKSRIPVNNSRIPSLSAPQSPQTIKPRYQSHIPTTANTTTTTTTSTTNGGVQQQNNKEIQQQQQRPPNQPRFEAFMMTGDLILNLSRTAQSSGLLPAQTKKVDSLRDSPIRSLKRKNGTAPQAKYDTSDSSPSISEEQNTTINSNTSDSMKNSYNNSSENNNRSVNKSVSNTSSKLSKIATATSDKTIMSMLKQVHRDGGSSSLDEDEEALVMSENGSSSSSHQKIVKSEKSKLKMLNSSRNALSSSSSSNSLPNNNYDDGGGGGGLVGGSVNDVIDCHQVTEERSTRSHSRKQQQTNQYTVLNNEEYHHHQVLTITEERKLQTLSVTPSASMSSTSTTSSASTTINRSETLLTPTPDLSYSVPTSPTSLSTPLLDAAKRKELASSVPTSPETGQQDLLRRNSGNSQQQNGMCVRKNDASGFRTSRSEDHLQNSQREGGLGSVVPIDIDEDVNSSLNTLLDTRHDSEDSQVSL